MIISHKHKYIFIKTNKTAGTSVEIALSMHGGESDIIAPISSKDEKLRKSLGGRGAQNCFSPLSDYRGEDYRILLLKWKRKRKFYNHISAGEIKGLVDPDIWNNYYKFCFERNPWDRIISLYFWTYKEEPRPSLKEFIQSGKPLHLKRRGFNLYSIDGKVAVDKVCRFENLAEELEAVRKQIGIPSPLVLPNAKGGHRKDKRSYRDVINSEDRDLISEMFRDEIALMGYEF